MPITDEDEEMEAKADHMANLDLLEMIGPMEDGPDGEAKHELVESELVKADAHAELEQKRPLTFALRYNECVLSAQVTFCPIGFTKMLHRLKFFSQT